MGRRITHSGALLGAVGGILAVFALAAAVALANNPPQASFTYSPAAAKPGEQVMFTTGVSPAPASRRS